ncbi:ABC transporter permease [Paenibacillus sp. FSL H7-0331]|nr:ABC transporter permease [Paenibacillus sp. FSL H7-0331]
MVRIIKSEITKLKRYSMVWVGFAAMLLVVLLTRFEATANNGVTYTFQDFSNAAIWNSFTLIFPATITLIAGYIINREQTDDTLKNILTIPVTFRRLLVGKLITVGMLAILFGAVSFVLTLIVFLMSGFPGLSAAVMVQSLFQMIGMNLCIYLAVLPIIVFTSRSTNGFMAGVGFAFFYGFVGIFASGHNLTNVYPIVAGLGIINYQEVGGSTYNLPLCYLTMFLVFLVSVALIAVMGNRIKEPKAKKRTARQKHKGRGR